MRSNLRHREVAELLAPGLDNLRFVVARPLGDLVVGTDVTADVRSGAIGESAMLSHVRRGVFVVRPDVALRNVAALKRASDRTVRSALLAAGVTAPASASTLQLRRLRAAIVAEVVA